MNLASLLQELRSRRYVTIRMGIVTATFSGVPNKVSVVIDGEEYPRVTILDGVIPVIGKNLWILDGGKGGWLGIGTTGNAPL